MVPEPFTKRTWLALVFVLVTGCYASHDLSSGFDASPWDAGVDADAGLDADVSPADAGVDADAMCDLRAVECTALPGCLGERPPETLYCDDIRICLFSDPGDEMATAIAAVSDRIQCSRADSCDFLCGLVDGVFDDEVRRELCAITRVAPSATIECSIYGP